MAQGSILDGRIAVITGAGSGIGRGIAAAMAAAGATVVVSDCNGDAARQTQTLIGASASAEICDVSDRESCDALASRLQINFGRINILVNNAGIVRKSPVRDPHSRAIWDEVLSTNLDGMFNMTTACVEMLIAAKGAIINIASIQAFVAGSGLTAYSVSKGGVRNLTINLAAELGPHGVRVNAIAPGFIETAMTQGMSASPEFATRFGSRLPLGRPGTPEDIGQPAVFLASDMARYITGAILPVDGGYLCY